MSWSRDFVHNCLVHPLMPFMPVKVANRFHDWNARWAFGDDRLDEMKIEHSLRDHHDGDRRDD